MQSRRIPLFPLKVVLRPRASLPLHIFEPRYRGMVKRCLEERSEFGVVLATPKGMVHVGCTAEITEVVKRYDDGRLDIETSGRAPFRVNEVFNENPLAEADVEYLLDDRVPPEEEIQKELVELYEACCVLMFSEPPLAIEVDQRVSAAYLVAGALPIDLLWKQQLLELRSEPERQKRLVRYLRGWAEELVNARRLRKRAGGNGHPAN